MEYLRPEQYYIDLYDLLTIKECIREMESCRKLYKEKSNDERIKNLPENEKIKLAKQLI